MGGRRPQLPGEPDDPDERRETACRDECVLDSEELSGPATGETRPLFPPQPLPPVPADLDVPAFRQLRAAFPDCQLILGVDRLDYSKGIPERLRAYRDALERYPELSFVISHFGGGLAGYKERIARSSYRFKLPKSFGDYFDRLYFDMAGFEGSPIALRCALEGIRAERMVFATDYPQNFNNDDPKVGKNVDGIREYIAEIQSLKLDTRIKNDMLGGTAARLLKLGV